MDWWSLLFKLKMAYDRIIALNMGEPEPFAAVERIDKHRRLHVTGTAWVEDDRHAGPGNPGS